MTPHRYRVVTDHYLGYEAQYRPWWCPVWLQCFEVNTHGSLDRALADIERHKVHIEPKPFRSVVVWPTPTQAKEK